MYNKILLISQVFFPDEVSTANLFTNLCSYLVREKVDVDVWCAQPSYTNFEKQSKNIEYNGIKIKFLSSTRFRKTNLVGRLINYLTFTASVALKLIFSKEKVPVFTHTTPPSLGIVIAFICSIKKRKFVYVLLDIFPEGLVRLGKVSKNNIFVRLWHYLFIQSLKKSTKIIVIGRDMKRYLENIYPGCLHKTEYIPLWQDKKLISPSEYLLNEYVIKHNLHNNFVVQYSGNMGLWNEMRTIGKVVKKDIPGVKFIIVGGGMRENELFEMLSTKDHKNLISLPFQSNENLSSVLTACHIALVTLRDNLEGMAVPSKIYGIMAAGIPVIALVPKSSEIALILHEENCGVVVDPSDVEGLINAILYLKSDGNLRNEMGQNGRMAFEQKYTTKIIASRYKSLIQTLN